MSTQPFSPAGRALFSSVLFAGLCVIFVATELGEMTLTFVHTNVGTTETVSGAWIRPPDLDSRRSSMKVSYSYEVDGTTYRKAGYVQKSYWKETEPSERRVPRVRYVVGSAEVARLDESGTEIPFWVVVASLPLAIIAFLYNIWGFVRRVV